MPRAKSTKFDVEVAAVRVVEALMGREVPDGEDWRKQTYFSDALDQVDHLKAENSAFEERVGELEEKVGVEEESTKEAMDERDKADEKLKVLERMKEAVVEAADQADTDLNSIGG